MMFPTSTNESLLQEVTENDTQYCTYEVNLQYIWLWVKIGTCAQNGTLVIGNMD